MNNEKKPLANISKYLKRVAQNNEREIYVLIGCGRVGAMGRERSSGNKWTPMSLVKKCIFRFVVL